MIFPKRRAHFCIPGSNPIILEASCTTRDETRHSIAVLIGRSKVILSISCTPIDFLANECVDIIVEVDEKCKDIHFFLNLKGMRCMMSKNPGVQGSYCRKKSSCVGCNVENSKITILSHCSRRIFIFVLS